jgi:hypothetical protein
MAVVIPTTHTQDMPHTFRKSHGGREKYFPTSLKKDATGDCVIRAIAIGTDQDYMQVWNDLFAAATALGIMPNEARVYEPYLASRGWVKHSFLKRPDGRKVAVRDFPCDNAIMLTCKHLTVIKDGVHLDSWDCGRGKANTYYTPKETL